MPKILKIFSSMFVAGAALLSLGTFSAAAQDLAPVKDSFGRTFAIKVAGAAAKPDTAALAVAKSFVDAHKDAIGLGGSELTYLAPEGDAIGTTVRATQSINGIPVYAGELYVIMNKLNRVDYVKTKLLRSLPASLTPNLTLKEAAGRAMAFAVEEARVQTAKHALRVSESELMLLPLGMLRNESGEKPVLAYRVEVLDVARGGELFSKQYFIDGLSGDIVLEISGNHAISTTRQVYDCSGGTGANSCVLDVADPYYPAYIHGRSEGKPERGPFPNPNFPIFYGSTEVDDMFQRLQDIQDYFSAVFGINGINGHGGMADWPSVPQNVTRGVVHNDLTSFSPACPGAMFSANTGTVTFCRGMLTPDVVGHEMTHGIVHHSFHDGGGFPIGDSYVGQTGALDEGSADYLGELVERALLGTIDWQSDTGASEPLYRDLADPHATFQFDRAYPYPDRFYDSGVYCGSADFGGAHYNMTILAHALYLMSVGGEHNGCYINGIGTDKVQQIIFRGWRNLFSRSVSFAEAYTDLILACNQLGYSSGECASVEKALQAVEMDQPGKCSSVPEVAPACAVNTFGSLNTCWPTGASATYFAPGEMVAIDGAGGIVGSEVKVLLLPHNANRPIWEQFTPLAETTTTVGPDGVSFAPLTNITTPSAYDVVVDSNMDGAYQPWADSVQAITVATPVDGDNLCYVGQSYTTSENCHDSINDCACAAGEQCLGNYSTGSLQYSCVAVSPGGGGRVRGKQKVQQEG